LDVEIQERIAQDINYIYDFSNYKLGDRYIYVHVYIYIDIKINIEAEFIY
jgi:hypothetical protein